MDFLMMQCKKVSLVMLLGILMACDGGSGNKKVTPPSVTVSSSSSSVLSVSSVGGSSVESSSSTALSSSSSSAPVAMYQLSLKGIVTDTVIANALVRITVGDKVFETTANAQGEYEILLSVGEQYLPALVKITATGVGSQADVVLVSLLPSVATLISQAGEDKVLDKRENFAVNVTNITTAEFALLTSSAVPDSDIALNAAQLRIAPDAKMTLAALIKIIIDQANYSLPPGSANTLEFAQNSSAVKKFEGAVIVKDQTLIANTIAAIKSDANITAAPDSPVVGQYIVNNPQEFISSSYLLDLQADGTGSIFYGETNYELLWKQEKNKVTIELLSPVLTGIYGYTYPLSADTVIHGRWQITALEFTVLAESHSLKTVDWNESVALIADKDGEPLKSEVWATHKNVIHTKKIIAPDTQRIVGTWILGGDRMDGDQIAFNNDGTGQFTRVDQTIAEPFTWQSTDNQIAMTFTGSDIKTRNIWFIGDKPLGYQIVAADFTATGMKALQSGVLIQKQDIHLTEKDIIGRAEIKYYGTDAVGSYGRFFDYLTGGVFYLPYTNFKLAWEFVDHDTWVEKYIANCAGGVNCDVVYKEQHDVIAQDGENYYELNSYNFDYQSPGQQAHTGHRITVRKKNYSLKEFGRWIDYTKFYSTNKNKVTFWQFVVARDTNTGALLNRVQISDTTPYYNDTFQVPYQIVGGKLLYLRDNKNKVLEIIEATQTGILVCEYDAGSSCRVGSEFLLEPYKESVTLTTEVSGPGSVTKSNATFGEVSSVTITPDNNYMIKSVTRCGGKLGYSDVYLTAPMVGDCTVKVIFSEKKPLAEAAGIVDPVLAKCVNDLNKSSLQHLTVLNCSDKEITSLAGLENLSGLVQLNLENAALPGHVDLRGLPHLKYLSLHHNNIDSIDISGNPLLESLNLTENNLSTVDTSGAYNLHYLEVSNNKLTTLDLANNSELRYVMADENLLETINLENLSELQGLYVGLNKLREIDLGGNKKLTHLFASGNLLTSLGLQALPELLFVGASHNQLTEIDFSLNPKLEHVSIAHNEISLIDVAMLPRLNTLVMDANKVSLLDVRNNLVLRQLYSGENLLTDIDLSQNTQLELVELSDNKMITLSGVENILDKNVHINLESNLFHSSSLDYLTDLKTNKNYTNIVY